MGDGRWEIGDRRREMGDRNHSLFPHSSTPLLPLLSLLPLFTLLTICYLTFFHTWILIQQLYLEELVACGVVALLSRLVQLG